MATQTDFTSLKEILKLRFEKNMHRHAGLIWSDVLKRLEANPDKLRALGEMENTGGEPDVCAAGQTAGEIIFYDCVAESPKGRRSLCYDRQALEARKEFKPVNTAVDMAATMGIELLNEDEYHFLQQFGPFDTKTSSWLLTPDAVRAAGGALFGDFRYGRVFVYHNGAESYYNVRGFRGLLRV